MALGSSDQLSTGISPQITNQLQEPDPEQFTCLYFGYGSNLSPRTIKQRCPDSLFISLARLGGWRWMINETGYANIVPGQSDDEVWGTLSFLSRRDEKALDESEGVPWMYEKVKLKVERVPQEIVGAEWKVTGKEELEATVYVDVRRVTEGQIEPDYVVWVKKAISDAKTCGLPNSYVENYIQKYLLQSQANNLPDREIMMVRTMQTGEKVTYGG